MAKSTRQNPNWFRRLLAPPVYVDEDLARSARLLHAIQLVMWTILILALVSIRLLGDTSVISLFVIGGVAVLQVVVAYLNHHGKVRLASGIFIVFQWLSATIAVAFLGGLSNPTISFVLLPIIIGSLLLGVQGIVLAGILTLISTTLIFTGSVAGVLAPTPLEPVPAQYWVDVILSIVIAGGLLYLASRSINDALTAAKRSAAALGQSNRELQEIRVSLEDRVAERTNQLSVSTEVSHAVSAILDPQELIGKVVPLIIERFHYYYAAIFLVDEDGEFAVLAEATGAAGKTLKERGHKLEISGPSMVGTAVATRRPRVAQDVGKETLRYANPLLTETRSEVALPLIVGDQVIGALDVQATRAYTFDEGTVAVLQGFAGQLAIAINNARQYQAAQLEARQVANLFEVSQSTSLLGQEFAAVVNRLFGIVAQRSDFDDWMAAEFDEQNHTYRVITAFDANVLDPIEPEGTVVNVLQQAPTPAALALTSRQTLIINDAETAPQLAQLPVEVRQRLGRQVIVPAMLGEKIIGVVSLGRTVDKPRLGTHEAQFAQTVANQLSVIIQNNRLLERAQQSVEELNQLMRRYTREGWTNLAKTRGTAELMQQYQRPDAPALEPEILDQIGQSITAGEVTPIGADGHTVISVPIALRGEVLGSLSVQDEPDRTWTPDELATLQAVADQVAQSMESARLLEESEISLHETTLLYQASRAITAAQTPREVLQAVVGIIDAPQIDRCVLALIEPDSPVNDPLVEIIAAWERDNPQPPTIGDRWNTSKVPLISHQTLEPLVFNDLADAAADPVSRHVFMNVFGVRAVAVIPMSASGRMVGWLLVEATHGPYHFTEQEIRRYRTLAGQAAVALENRRLFQDVEARVNELTILTRIGRRLASTLDLDEILDSVVEETLRATRATQASIALYREGEDALEVRVMRGYDPQVEAQVVGALIHAGEGLHGRLLENGEAVLVNDVRLEPDYREVSSTTCSEYLAPIKQGGLLLGALNLESPLPSAFTDADVRLIDAMADQMAVAITNARAYEAERQAVERMREADRLKTQFLANMSHELRTPLNSIIGFSRVMLRGIDGPVSDMQQTDLTSIYNSGQHLLGLINNILDFSKIEAGKMELSIEPVNLIDIAKTVMSTAIALVKDKPIKLEQEVPQDLPIVMADQTRVRQIILNIVSNAAKFTDKGFIRLRMVPTPQEVLISVTDTGIGIPPDKLDHIFEEFTQVDASTTRRYGGTGLGLAITRSFVELHKGRIWVESEVGVGSTFNFTLPREQVEPESAVALPTDLEARGDGKKLILCVDDDPGVITLYKRYLEKQGYVVIGVTDSTKAVEEAKRLLPYAITLDVLMPNRDGWQTLSDLKKTPEISSTPILVCSIILDKTKGFSLGAADYLVKPITEDELLRALERVKRKRDIHKILIVDDEPSALQLLRRILESQPGYQVLEATSGGLALSIVQSDKPELIILDLMMPEIDGFAVLETIKSNAATRDIPVIIVTAKEITAEDRERLDGHMIALFNKGMFTADELLENIARVLENMNKEIAHEGKKVEVFHQTAL